MESTTDNANAPTPSLPSTKIQSVPYLATPVAVFLSNHKCVPYVKLSSTSHFQAQKEELTRWWLNLIEQSVDSFLLSLGYNFDAVPFHYIDQPPKSMEAIKKNHHIIRLLLKSTGTSPESEAMPLRHHLRTFLVEPLKSQIYNKIESYLHSIKLFLWHECSHHLHIYFTPQDDQILSQDLDMSTVLPLVRDHLKSKNITDDRVKLLESLFGDIGYIQEMKRLEGDFFKKVEAAAPAAATGKKGGAPSDIVPLTGLIIGKLHRIDNELKTVIEHWSGRMH